MTNSTENLVDLDIVLCYLPAGGLAASKQGCDLNSNSAAMGIVPSQILQCSSRLSAHSVRDMMLSVQHSPLDFASLETLQATLKHIPVSVTVQLSFTDCSDRANLPNVEPSNDYLLAVVLNPLADLISGAADTFDQLGNCRDPGPCSNSAGQIRYFHGAGSADAQQGIVRIISEKP